MAFDPNAYEEGVIRPLRGVHGSLPAGDLWVRYAIAGDLPGEQLASHLAAVRRYWRERAEEGGHAAEVCRLLLAEDERLRHQYGDALMQPSWWRERRSGPGPAEPTVPETAAPVGVPATDLVDTHWHGEALAHIRGWLTGPRGVGPLDGLGGRPAQDLRPPPRAHPVPLVPTVDDFTVVVRSTDGDRCMLEFSWTTPSGQRVEVLRCPGVPRWPAGTVVPESALAAMGVPVAGTRGGAAGHPTMVAEEPVGYLVYVPVGLRDGRATIGHPAAVAVAGPVRRLRIRRMGRDAVVTWVWPDTASSVEIDWRTRAGAGRRIVTVDEFTDDARCVLPVGRDGVDISVRATLLLHGTRVKSPPRTAVLGPAPARVGYEVRHSRSTGQSPRSVTVEFSSADECPPFDAVVVLAHGDIMPFDASMGRVLGRVRVGLHGSTPSAYSFVLAAEDTARRPYWIRCFAEPVDVVSMVDPPVDRLKVV
ncbi:hypothetical protein [Hamadaea tsunoensis]|uniref:hypothetical protein n=1 Tax=Hamadaea tsunoensis TaxID=53368 RepID=UPI0003FEEC43|nr:hypothetical protein [Hamadaea tsunoensis]